MEPNKEKEEDNHNQYQGNQNNQNKDNNHFYQKKGYRRGNYRGNNNFRGRGNFQQNQYRPQIQNRQYINPYYAQEMIYRTEMYIYTKYRHLIDINVKNNGLSKKLTDSSSFYVIKSFSEENVHKSIKYGVWSSSKNGNQTLTNSYNLVQGKKGDVYLFFSCNGSGRFVGVARMKSACDNNKSFEYWTQDGKWPGIFEVEWVFIKDVPFKEFKNIIITMKDGETKPISNARDTQEIPFEFAKVMIEKIDKYQNSNTILEHFEYYDIRQENYEKQIKLMKEQKQNQNQNHQKAACFNLNFPSNTYSKILLC